MTAQFSQIYAARVPTCHYVTDGEPSVTRELFRAACLQRDWQFSTVRARSFEFVGPDQRLDGDIVYRPATSSLAQLVEEHLRGNGATALPDGQAISSAAALQVMRRRGVPVVNFSLCTSHNRGAITRAVDMLGGLPVVVTVPGGEGGIGVLLAETKRSLFSLVDYVTALGVTPLLTSFVPDATHWRCIVLGPQLVASYGNEPIPDDFRTAAPTAASAYVVDAPPAVGDAAINAVQSLGLDFGGVDVLVDARGNASVIEVNAPCFFAPAQTLGGIDVAGMVVDHLIGLASSRA